MLEQGNGFTLLSANKQGHVNQPNETASNSYENWRVRSVLIMLAGFVFIFFVFMDLVNSYRKYGTYFWMNSQNIIFPLAAGVLAIFLVAGGYWLFRYVEKKQKRMEAPNKTNSECREI